MKGFVKKSFFCLVLIILTFSCKAQKLEEKDFLILKDDGTTLSVRAELAKTPEEQEKGYMFRENIPEGTGMLFIFPYDKIMAFWMKNTPHPLSIAYIDYSGRIRDIYDMTPHSLEEIVSTGYVRYALEVPQGWFKKNGVKPGDYMDLTPLK